MTNGMDPVSVLLRALWGSANSITAFVGLSVVDVLLILGSLLLLALVFQLYCAVTGRTNFSLEEGARRDP